MKWVWPINWYLRIRELEAKCAALERKNLELDSAFRAAAIQQTAMAAAYVAAVASITSTLSSHG
jgi:hypothetical protein